MEKVAFDDLAARFDRLIEQVESADVRVPEDSALISLASDLVPKVTRLLRRGIELLVEIEERYLAEPGPSGGDASGAADSFETLDPLASLSSIGAQISAEFAVRDLNNVAFFARTDLRSALDGLIASATQNRDQLTLASNCEAGLRRLRKALVSVESALHEFESREPPVRHWFDLEVSLQIRRLYWNLRRETGAGPEEERKERPIEARLRSILYRVLAFRELSIYPFLRVDDRVHLRRLLKRILDWLNGDEQDPQVARRLWQDLAGFAELLVQVSHRQELQDHDRRLLHRAYHALFPGGVAVEKIPGRLLGDMQSLLGLSPELDELLEARTADVELWRAPIERLRATLGHGTELAAPPELWR